MDLRANVDALSLENKNVDWEDQTGVIFKIEKIRMDQYKNHRVAAILLNYNTASDCRKCISYLKKQQGIELEIILVDNCSKADEVAEVEKISHEEGCTFIGNRENRGYNAGNNIGLRYAASQGYQYALIANPDMEFPQSDYLQKMVSVMDQDESVAVVGSDIVTPEGIHQNPMMRDGDWKGSLGWITSLFRKKKEDTYDFIDNYGANHYCSKVSGCCFLIRMDFVQSIGFFDEQVFLYCEEAILSRQVEQAGKKMYYLADVQAVHAHIKSEKGNPIKRFQNWKRSRLYYIDRYSGDSWWGRQIAKCSMRMYVRLMVLYNRVRR